MEHLALFPVSATVCAFFSYCVIWVKFGIELNGIWPTSTYTGGVDRWSTPSNFHCEGTLRFIRQPVKCTTATGDNEASNCSQVKCCYLYANEGGSKNFISIKKSTHTFLEIPVLVFSFVWCWFCSCTWMYWAVCLKGRYGRMHSQMRSFWPRRV